MSATLAPNGFVPVRHPSGQNRANPWPSRNNAGTGYATSIFKGDTVILDTAGYIVIGTTAADLLGVFQGCEYVDATGKPTVSNYWPASTVLQNSSTRVVAWVIDDYETVFSVQATGSIAVTALGDQADIDTSTAGSTTTGISGQGLSSTFKGAGVQGQFSIIDVDRAIDNDWGDTYTRVLVKLIRPQLKAVKVAI